MVRIAAAATTKASTGATAAGTRTFSMMPSPLMAEAPCAANAAPIRPPIIGATKMHHLDDALGAIDVKLSTEEIASLEAPYQPHFVRGWRQ